MQETKIEWADHTFNPWVGCTKVSAGCQNCYAEALMDHRFGRVEWGPKGERKRTSDANWRLPLKWNRQAEREGRRYRVFCASLADVFEDNEQVARWQAELFGLIAETPHLDWLLLTKRPENVMDIVPMLWHSEPTWDGGWEYVDQWPRNVWIGTSVENQEQANKRIPELLKIPAHYRFLSMEPLLGPVEFAQVPGFNRMRLDLSGWWVIVGGESGQRARPMSLEWVRSIRDQCSAANAPFFFKQKITNGRKESLPMLDGKRHFASPSQEGTGARREQ